MPENDTRKTFELCLCVTKCSNTLKLYTIKALLCKNRLYFFFLIFWHAKIPPSFRVPRYWH